MTRNRTRNWYKVSVALLFLGPAWSMQAQPEKFPLLRGAEILLLDGEGHELSKLTSDRRPKGNLRWAVGGRRLAYQVKADDGAKGRLVIIDLKGQVLKEISLGAALLDFAILSGYERSFAGARPPTTFVPC